MRKEDYKNLGVKSGPSDGQRVRRKAAREYGVKNGSGKRSSVRRTEADYDLKNGADHSEYRERSGTGANAYLRKRRKGSRLKLAAVIIAACVLLTGLYAAYGPARLVADINAYKDTPILVTGLRDEDFYVTPEELAGLPLTRVTATGNSEKAGTVSAIGPTMDTFIEAYGEGAVKADFREVKFYASDQYTVPLVKSFHEKDIVLSIANGKEPLEEWQQPLRMVIPGEDSGTWIRLVTEIAFTRFDETQ